MAWRQQGGGGGGYGRQQGGAQRGGGHNQRSNQGRQQGGSGAVRQDRPPRQSDYLVPMLPFSTKKRSIQEHRARNPHRKHFHEYVTELTAGWVEEKEPVLADKMSDVLDLTLSSTESIEAPVTEAPADKDNCVNVRLFLVCGIGKPTDATPSAPCKHVMRRIDIIGASLSAESRQLATYGGLLPKGSDSQLISGLISLVKTQCSLDLSSVTHWTRLGEITYEDAPSTIFFFPHAWGIPGLKLMPQVKHVEEQYEEEVTEEVEAEEDGAEEGAEGKENAAEVKENGEGDEAMEDKEDKEDNEDKEKENGEEADGAPPKKKTKTVKKIVSKTRSKEVKVMTPTKFTMATLHEFGLTVSTNNDTTELCTAVDLFDEWVKRDFATRIIELLGEKREEAKLRIIENKKKEEEEQQRKRKRAEHEECCKKRKEEKIEKLRKDWEADDVGKTDEDKKEDEEQRTIQLNELDAEEKEMLDAMNKAEFGDEGGEEAKRKRKIGVRVQRLYDMFQFFDRPRGLTQTSLNSLSREWLAQQLLCLDDERTYGECLELTTLGNLYAKTTPLNYNAFTTEEKEVDDEPKKDDDEMMAAPEEQEPEPEQVQGDGEGVEGAEGNLDAEQAAE